MTNILMSVAFILQEIYRNNEEMKKNTDNKSDAREYFFPLAYPRLIDHVADIKQKLPIELLKKNSSLVNYKANIPICAMFIEIKNGETLSSLSVVFYKGK